MAQPARLETVDLTDAANKKIGAYSKGMRQRVKLAQALAHDPELLILDEPLSGMDPLARRKTIRLIKDWGRAGQSVIVSSHILHEIESMTSNILLINQGRILAEGNVHQIRELIDEHPHTVHIRADQPRALAREFLADDDVLSLKFEDGAVVVQTGEARCVLRAADRAGGVGRARRHPRSHLARRQPAGGLPVPGEVMTETVRPRDRDARAVVASAAADLRPVARADALVAALGLPGAAPRRAGRCSPSLVRIVDSLHDVAAFRDQRRAGRRAGPSSA